MKKKKLYFLILIIPFIVSWNLDWVNKIEKKIERINKNAIQISIRNNIMLNVNSETKTFKTETETKVQITYFYEKYINVKQEYFKNKRGIFAKTEKGIVPKIYKKKKKKNEPYGVIFEKIIYFKNKNLGIEKYRELPVNGNEDYQNLRLILSKKEFKINNIGLQKYLQIENKYNEIKKN